MASPTTDKDLSNLAAYYKAGLADYVSSDYIDIAGASEVAKRTLPAEPRKPTLNLHNKTLRLYDRATARAVLTLEPLDAIYSSPYESIASTDEDAVAEKTDHVFCMKCLKPLSLPVAEELFTPSQAIYEPSKAELSTPKGWARAALQKMNPTHPISRALSYFLDNADFLEAQVIDGKEQFLSAYETHPKKGQAWDSDLYAVSSDIENSATSWDSAIYAVGSTSDVTLNIFPCGHASHEEHEMVVCSEECCKDIAKAFDYTSLKITFHPIDYELPALGQRLESFTEPAEKKSLLQKAKETLWGNS